MVHETKFVSDRPLTPNTVDLNVNCSSAVNLRPSNVNARLGGFPAVVGLCGLAGAGKSTCALWLQERGYQRIRFAGPLKKMLWSLGLGERHTDGDLKEVPHRLLNGRTPRQAMQWLGTEWGRSMFGDDFWTNIWLQTAEAILPYQPVVVDDLRFDNEAQAVHALGGVVIKIECPWAGAASSAAHSSESGVSQYDVIVRNDVRGDPETMLRALRDALGLPEGTDFTNG